MIRFIPRKPEETTVLAVFRNKDTNEQMERVHMMGSYLMYVLQKEGGAVYAEHCDSLEKYLTQGPNPKPLTLELTRALLEINVCCPIAVYYMGRGTPELEYALTTSDIYEPICHDPSMVNLTQFEYEGSPYLCFSLDDPLLGVNESATERVGKTIYGNAVMASPALMMGLDSERMGAH